MRTKLLPLVQVQPDGDLCKPSRLGRRPGSRQQDAGETVYATDVKFMKSKSRTITVRYLGKHGSDIITGNICMFGTKGPD